MKVIKIISEWRKRPTYKMMKTNGFFGPHQKMVMAIVEIAGQRFTRHIAVAR